GGLFVAPSMDPALASVALPLEDAAIGARTVRVAGIAILIGVAAGFVAEALLRLIGLITSAVFFQTFSTELQSPALAERGVWMIAVPVVGALIIGLMARFGSAAIRGHGIPEVMEKVLYGESRIPTRVMFLKPLSAAIAIGTGGPFGAEGPIIATGGALGSTVGQILRITADERKTLLAAGAAAGMAATFGSPVSAVLLAIELLLFEYRARSIIPVALAAAAATSVRMILVGPDPVFAMPPITQPGGAALASYVVLGALIGVAAAGTTRAVYAIEDAFERLPIHWMWWPALGAIVVGVIGYYDPRTLSVGYEWIEQILSGEITGMALLLFIALKFVSWSVYLGSGTSGGTLAPLFIIGGGLGVALGGAADSLWPGLGIDVSVAGLVGMAAIFAGASHALLASVVFAFETTRQPLGLLPLLAGCSAAYLVMLLLMRNSIMTEKLARRGTSIRTEYSVDFLSQVLVGDAMSRDPITVDVDRSLKDVRAWLRAGAGGATHQGSRSSMATAQWSAWSRAVTCSAPSRTRRPSGMS
ncbi:MAG TPA: chloride channel protein, partial [Longimicrobiales bacterium]|nr:chloride channel protein [Longimicrobiales bacterium]